MKYLTDKDILKWNDRLDKSKFKLVPRYNNRNGYPDISINVINEGYFDRYNPSNKNHEEVSHDPEIKYEFSFSIVKNRKDEFFILLNKMLKRTLATHLVHEDSRNILRSKPIEGYKDSNIEKSSVEHSFLDRTFIKYTYRFNGGLSSIISHISNIEDTIKYFQMIWGYDENGSEICLTKYKIGDIVCFNKDNSKDFLIVDYYYDRIDDDYKIDYVISEIIGSQNSTIIQYGKGMTVFEDDLIYSRNNRIDNILN